MSIQIVILAAGQGTRMKSAQPKVLHRLAGKPLLEHIIGTALNIAPNQPPVVILGHQGALLQAALAHYHLQCVEQKEQLGTGHALLQALPLLQSHRILVLSGDVPLISEFTLNQLIISTPEDAVGLITVQTKNPSGYGRIVRDKQGRLVNIVEEKDADAKTRAITEINTGIYLLPLAYLKKWLPKLSNHNAQNEYYLTEVISCAIKAHVPVHTVLAAREEEVLGVNDRLQLAQMERYYQLQTAKHLMQNGVTIMDPTRLDIRGDVQIDSDVTLDVNVILEGRVVIGEGSYIGANCYLRDVVIGKDVIVKPHSMIEGAEVARGCQIGPFARLRPGTVLAANVHIGNFVEVKNSDVGTHSKINHLSYVGDSQLGKQVNIGAGTITCNYDGANKLRTVIGDNVHIGSNTQLIAPVIVGEGATIGAGSTITKDVPPHQLTLTHKLEQRSKAWSRPVKKEMVEK